MQQFSRIAVAWILGRDLEHVGVHHLPLFVQRQVVTRLSRKGQMLLTDVGQDFLIAQVFVIEIGNFAVEAVDVIESKFAGRQGLAPLGGGGTADPTNAGKVDVEIIGSTWIFIADLQGRRAGSVTWIAVDAQLYIIDVFITGNRGFRIQRIARAGKKKVGNKIGAALGAVFFDRNP